MKGRVRRFEEKVRKRELAWLSANSVNSGIHSKSKVVTAQFGGVFAMFKGDFEQIT